MRYNELVEAAGWRRYTGEGRPCVLNPSSPDHGPEGSHDARIQHGSVSTGKQRVWVGYFVQVVQHEGKEWLAEHPYSLRAALREVEAQLNADGWTLNVIGLDPEWRESGLSANSGWGYRRDYDRAAHMLEPPKSTLE